MSTGNVTLSNKVGESAKESATIEKGSKSDFLVGLSALSSTAKIMGQTTVPLDIVLVLDVSGSMEDNGKMKTLKTAVNNFIDTTAAENDKRSDVNKQSRISLVKFAGKKKDRSEMILTKTEAIYTITLRSSVNMKPIPVQIKKHLKTR